jgi:TatD DNase family protein
MTSGYVDAHTHLVHEGFVGEEDAVAARAAAAGLDRVVVNGLDPPCNRAVLALCQRHGHLLPALGIYPVDAVAARIDRAAWPHPFPPPEPFDVDAEIDWIEAQADGIAAIGEIGLDQHWVRDQAAEQERVLTRLLAVARRHALPVILHSRRAEERTWEIVRASGVERVLFHCWGGRLRLALEIAQHGVFFSIPPVVVRAQAFQRLATELPLGCLLTETDAPFMGPEPGQRNEPANVPVAVAKLAELRGLPEPEMRQQIRENFRKLVGR